MCVVLSYTCMVFYCAIQRHAWCSTVLFKDHLDLSRCPLLHKSLQPPCITTVTVVIQPESSGCSKTCMVFYCAIQRHAWCSIVLSKDMHGVLLCYSKTCMVFYCAIQRHASCSTVLSKDMHGVLLNYSKLYCAICNVSHQLLMNTNNQYFIIPTCVI